MMKTGIQFICVVLTLSFECHARVKPNDDISPKKSITSAYPEKVIEYLKSYGYLTEDDSNKSDGISQGLSKFQTFMGLVPEGTLNKKTKILMETPRCGEVDIHPDKAKTPLSLPNLLKRKVILYNIKEWTPWIPNTLQNQTIYNMLRLWADDVSIKAHWSVDKADVEIIFKPEKRKGLVSANYEVYTNVKYIKGVFKIYFYSNAAYRVSVLSKASAHAFGHVFGHRHTNLYSLMSPIFREDRKMLYDRCDIPVDSAFLMAHIGTTFFTSGSMVWSIKEKYNFTKPPSKSQEIWNGLPSEIDGGFAWPFNWETYIFKGNYYYRYNIDKNSVDDGYPRPIGDGWAGVPGNIDAVVSDSNGNTFFFKGDLVYMFDDKINRVHPAYPKKISEVFPGVPNNIDSALRYYDDGVMYFFKDVHFYHWTEKSKKADGPYFIKFGWSHLCREDF